MLKESSILKTLSAYHRRRLTTRRWCREEQREINRGCPTMVPVLVYSCKSAHFILKKKQTFDIFAWGKW